MCTVTFFPQENGFILTSNRDEHIARKQSSLPEYEQIGNTKVLFPRDNEAKGSWIIASQKGRLVCLLNGAFEKHNRILPYRKSRGIIVREIFELDSFQDFINNYDLDNIEPFTLAWVEKNGQELYDFKWNGNEKWFGKLDSSKHHIWSSATLYSSELKVKREEWLKEWFQDNTFFTAQKIFDFHTDAGDGNIEYSTKMQRENGVQTVSITQVVATKSNFNMFHKNFPAHIEGSEDLIING